MNFGNLLQQAQQMQRKVNKAKKEFDEREFEFNSQDDLIVGKMKGNLSIIELHIAPSLMQEDQDNMEALLMATINQTIAKVSKEREDTLNQVTNGVDVSAFLKWNIHKVLKNWLNVLKCYQVLEQKELNDLFIMFFQWIYNKLKDSQMPY